MLQSDHEPPLDPLESTRTVTYKSSSSFEPDAANGSLVGLAFGFEPPRMDNAVAPPTNPSVARARYSEATLRPAMMLQQQRNSRTMHDSKSTTSRELMSL
jgi:hypothetical protein